MTKTFEAAGPFIGGLLYIVVVILNIINKESLIVLIISIVTTLVFLGYSAYVYFWKYERLRSHDK